MKSLFSTAVMLTALTLSAENLFTLSAPQDFNTPQKLTAAGDALETAAPGWFMSMKQMEIDPAKTYRIEGEFRTAPGKTVKGKFSIGFYGLDKDGHVIQVTSVNAAAGSETELAAPVNAADTVLKIKDGSKWQNQGYVAYDVDPSGKQRDLPCKTVLNAITKTVKKNGAVYEAEAGARKWTDQCFVDTMNAWQKLFSEGIFEDGALGVATYPDARDQYFYARKAVFFMTGSWHLGPTSPSNSELEGTEIKNQGDVIGMEPFPSMVDSGVQLASSGVDVMICMNKDCKEQEAAMKFIEYLANGAGQQYWVNYLQGSPVSNNISYTGEIDGELQQQSIDNVNNYVLNAAGNRKLSSSEITTALGVAMQNVAAGADPLTELEEVQSIADSLE